MATAKTTYKKPKVAVQSVTPFLWFDTKAAEAAAYYTSIFQGSKMIDSNPMSSTFMLAGQEFMALNGGPQYKFTPAISLFVSVKTQRQVDELWERLSHGGKKGRCGWLEDKYGLSWQIIPNRLGELMGDKDQEAAGRVVQAMLKMTKIDIQSLEAAYAGK